MDLKKTLFEKKVRLYGAGGDFSETMVRELGVGD